MQEFSKIDDLILKLSNDPYSPEISLSLAIEYEDIGQTASAVSFYLRTAEYGYYSHRGHVYASLLRSAHCFENQKGRSMTVHNLLLKAIAYEPTRPEAWFFISKYYEKENKWQESYTCAETGLSRVTQAHGSLPINLSYPGVPGLLFQKAVAAWWVGREDESRRIFIDLSKQDIPNLYKNSVKYNMDSLNIVESELEQLSTFDKYQKNGFGQVPGWVVRTLPDFMRVLKDVEWNKTGGVAEVGVYMGRFFLLLRSMLDSPEQSYAIDVFEDQHLNIDSSGTNNARSNIFQDYVDKFDSFKGKGVISIKGDSTSSATKAELDKTIAQGSIRFFSIDGGHTKTHTINDLKIAEKFVSDTGVVILDDILHPHWLGVMDGALEYLRDFPTLVPFAVGHNKLFLCKFSYHSKYVEAIKDSGFGIQLIWLMGHQIWVTEKVNIQ